MKLFKNIFAYILFFSLPFYSSLYAANYGLFVGTSQYNGSHDLSHTVEDAKQLHYTMMRSGILRSRNSSHETGYMTKSEIRAQIISQARKTKRGDTFIFYNASHGTKDGRICASDGYITSEELSSWIGQSQCSKVLFINQTCYSGKFKLSIPGKKVCQLTSSGKDNKSWNARWSSPVTGKFHGLYTKYLIEAMNPENSDKNGDGLVTALEIQQFINKKIETNEYKKSLERLKQNPYYSFSIEALNQRECDLKAKLDEIKGMAEKLQEKGLSVQDVIAKPSLAIGTLDNNQLRILNNQVYYQEHYNYIREALTPRFQMDKNHEGRWKDQLPVLWGDPDFVVIDTHKKDLIIHGISFKQNTSFGPIEYKGDIDVAIDFEENKAIVFMDEGREYREHKVYYDNTLKQHNKLTLKRAWLDIDGAFDIKIKEKRGDLQKFIVKKLKAKVTNAVPIPNSELWNYTTGPELTGDMEITVNYDKGLAKGIWLGKKFLAVAKYSEYDAGDQALLEGSPAPWNGWEYPLNEKEKKLRKKISNVYKKIKF